jgi:glutaredoxin-related protein
MVAMLRNVNAKFTAYDVLGDEEVRQGLKELSDWPTYPQLYLDGELLGGLDVVAEEMRSNPNFLNNLPKVAADGSGVDAGGGGGKDRSG